MGFRYRLCMVAVLVITLGMMLGAIGQSAADSAPTMQLIISEFKVTTADGQFFTLYNPSSTASVELKDYQLQYFNNNDLTRATSSKIISLNGTLPPRGYYMISDGAATICYQLTVASASLGFSTTSGFVELLRMPASSPGLPISPIMTDYVSWSKTTSKNVDSLGVNSPAANIQVPAGTAVTWYRNISPEHPAQSSWQAVQPDSANACSLQIIQSTSDGGQLGMVNVSQLANGPEPPATIINLSGSATGEGAAALPAADIGLAAPKITELLPNPEGTGNDASDEFIELYNGNTVAFDLSGFTLQTGTTTKHSYVFPDGTKLAPQSFTAFYSRDTGLSLSNTSGQADLQDPLGNTLSTTDPYGTAKEGQSWALAKGVWYWTSRVTPNSANIVQQDASKSSQAAKKKSATTASASAVKGASTTAAGSSYAGGQDDAPAPIHPLVLAVVVALAVGYGVYEYRHDIANKIHELRSDRRDSPADRGALARR